LHGAGTSSPSRSEAYRGILEAIHVVTASVIDAMLSRIVFSNSYHLV
jgi:hypothetical protein